MFQFIPREMLWTTSSPILAPLLSICNGIHLYTYYCVLSELKTCQSRSPCNFNRDNGYLLNMRIIKATTSIIIIFILINNMRVSAHSFWVLVYCGGQNLSTSLDSSNQRPMLPWLTRYQLLCPPPPFQKHCFPQDEITESWHLPSSMIMIQLWVARSTLHGRTHNQWGWQLDLLVWKVWKSWHRSHVSLSLSLSNPNKTNGRKSEWEEHYHYTIATCYQPPLSSPTPVAMLVKKWEGQYYLTFCPLLSMFVLHALLHFSSGGDREGGGSHHFAASHTANLPAPRLGW